MSGRGDVRGTRQGGGPVFIPHAKHCAEPRGSCPGGLAGCREDRQAEGKEHRAAWLVLQQSSGWSARSLRETSSQLPGQWWGWSRGRFAGAELSKDGWELAW